MRSVEELYEKLELFNARRGTQDAKNFAIVNELYLSKEVSSKVFGLLKLLSDVRIDVELSAMDPSLRKSAKEEAKKMDPAIENLLDTMRKELGSGLIESSQARRVDIKPLSYRFCRNSIVRSSWAWTGLPFRRVG